MSDNRRTSAFKNEGPLCPDCGFKHREDNCPNRPATSDNRRTSALNGTLEAYFGNRTIHFTDYVYDGDSVDVYGTFEDAEEERGPWVSCVVSWNGEEWLLNER